MKIQRFPFVSEEMLSTRKMKIVKFDLAYHNIIRFWLMIMKHRKKREFNYNNSEGYKKIISFYKFIILFQNFIFPT